MISKSINDFISNRAWLRDVVGETGQILCKVSALEYLEMFVGYFGETEIEVYSKSKGVYENINYTILDTYDNIDYFQDGNILCCTFEQAINDIMADWENADRQAAAEGIAEYYHSHNKSYNGLNIWPQNIEIFNEIKEWGIDYYKE